MVESPITTIASSAIIASVIGAIAWLGSRLSRRPRFCIPVARFGHRNPSISIESIATGDPHVRVYPVRVFSPENSNVTDANTSPLDRAIHAGPITSRHPAPIEGTECQRPTSCCTIERECGWRKLVRELVGTSHGYRRQATCGRHSSRGDPCR